VRPAWPADAREIAALERRCFGDPWSLQSFREALGSELSFGLVAECRGEIAGYLIGRATLGAGEILNLAVAPEWRRRRLGRLLLEAGLDALASRGAEEVFLEVRESNRSAQSLYLSSGFRPVGQRAAYYRNPKEDALVLWLALEQHA
jgi:ribosomal-protein-alanine N-acetyltransferase